MKRGHRRGFSLIEVMMVVAIIGVLSAVAGPNLLKRAQRARASQRDQSVRLIEDAAKRYYDEHGRWPTATGTGTKFDGAWNPASIAGGSGRFLPSAWAPLILPVEGAQRFQYQLAAVDDKGSAGKGNKGKGNQGDKGKGNDGTAGTGVTMVLTVRSDLDGNGVYGVVTRTWTLAGNNWMLSETRTGDSE